MGPTMVGRTLNWQDELTLAHFCTPLRSGARGSLSWPMAKRKGRMRLCKLIIADGANCRRAVRLRA